MRRKEEFRWYFLAAGMFILLAAQHSLAYTATVSGEVFNASNQSNFYEFLGATIGEPDSLVSLWYDNDGTQTMLTTTTAGDGSYSFNVVDFPPGGVFTINATKDRYRSSNQSRKFPDSDSDGTVRMGPVTIKDIPVIFSIMPNRTIINKNESVRHTVEIQNNYATVGIAVWPNYTRAMSTDFIEGDLFVKNQSSNPDYRGFWFWNGTTLYNEHIVISVVLGPTTKAVDNGTFFTSNATGNKNGTMSLVLNGIQIADSFISFARFIVNSGTVMVTFPPDVNGDGNVTAADVGKINYCLKMKYTVVQCGEHTDVNLDNNVNITAADLGAVRYAINQTLVWEY